MTSLKKTFTVRDAKGFVRTVGVTTASRLVRAGGTVITFAPGYGLSRDGTRVKKLTAKASTKELVRSVVGDIFGRVRERNAVPDMLRGIFGRVIQRDNERRDKASRLIQGAFRRSKELFKVSIQAYDTFFEGKQAPRDKPTIVRNINGTDMTFWQKASEVDVFMSRKAMRWAQVSVSREYFVDSMTAQDPESSDDRVIKNLLETIKNGNPNYYDDLRDTYLANSSAVPVDRLLIVSNVRRTSEGVDRQTASALFAQRIVRARDLKRIAINDRHNTMEAVAKRPKIDAKYCVKVAWEQANADEIASHYSYIKDVLDDDEYTLDEAVEKMGKYVNVYVLDDHDRVIFKKRPPLRPNGAPGDYRSKNKTVALKLADDHVYFVTGYHGLDKYPMLSDDINLTAGTRITPMPVPEKDRVVCDDIDRILSGELQRVTWTKSLWSLVDGLFQRGIRPNELTVTPCGNLGTMKLYLTKKHRVDIKGIKGTVASEDNVELIPQVEKSTAVLQGKIMAPHLKGHWSETMFGYFQQAVSEPLRYAGRAKMSLLKGVYETDMSACYPTLLGMVKRVAVPTTYDRFVKLPHGTVKIDPWKWYIVKPIGEPEGQAFWYFGNQKHKLALGWSILTLKLKVKVTHELDTIYRNVEFKKALDEVPTELGADRKTVRNSVIGMTGKYKAKARISKLYTNNGYADFIANVEEKYKPSRQRIFGKNKEDNDYHLVTWHAENIVLENWKMIAFTVYDMARAWIASVTTRDTLAVNVDAVYSVTPIEASSKGFKASVPLTEARLINDFWLRRVRPPVPVEKDPEVTVSHLRDEYSVDEVCDFLERNPVCYVTGRDAGTGKTSACCEFINRHGMRTLVVSRCHERIQDTLGKLHENCDGITCASLFGTHGGQKKNVKLHEYDCVLLEEIGMFDESELMYARKLVENFEGSAVLATGDQKQLAPVNASSTASWRRRALDVMFPCQLELLYSKRIPTEEHELLEEFREMCFSGKYSTKEVVLRMDFPRKYWKKRELPPMKDSLLVAHTQYAVYKRVDEALRGNKYFAVGKEWTSRSSRYVTNSTWTVSQVRGLEVTLVRNGEALTFTKEQLRSERAFIPRVAGTCHALQGCTFDGYVVVCGWSSEHCTPEWLYTAVTRARSLKKVVFVKDDEAIWQEFKGELTRRGAQAGIGFSELYELFKKQKFACNECSGDLMDYDLDHIDPNNRVLSGNCQILCSVCNRRKSVHDKHVKD